MVKFCLSFDLLPELKSQIEIGKKFFYLMDSRRSDMVSELFLQLERDVRVEFTRVNLLKWKVVGGAHNFLPANNICHCKYCHRK